MNLLLVEPGEFAATASCTLSDRRAAASARRSSASTVGSRVRAGVLGGGVGTAEVIADRRRRDHAAPRARRAAPPPLPVELVLAVPRPKVLTRTIEIAAAFARRADRR